MEKVLAVPKNFVCPENFLGGGGGGGGGEVAEINLFHKKFFDGQQFSLA